MNQRNECEKIRKDEKLRNASNLVNRVHQSAFPVSCMTPASCTAVSCTAAHAY